MDWKNTILKNLFQVVFSLIISAHLGHCNDLKNHHPNHRHSLMTMSDLANHWIGMPKSPYAHYSSAITPTTLVATSPPTSSPISIKRKTMPSSKPKKRKTEEHSRRRSDSSITRRKDKNYYDDIDDENPRRRSDGSISRKRDKNYYDDSDDQFDYDYDYDTYAPPRVTPPPSQYFIRGSASPKTMFMNPSGSSSTVNKIFAAVPKVATYVVPSSKTYVVSRVKSEAVYVPPSAKVAYAASNNKAGMRRQDPLDYDDNPSGVSYIGPRNSFPPRPVMNKITGPGQRQPCHGPECHQHHKGLVRFYWRRVIYPPGTNGRRRRPARLRNRRRFGDRARSPSDQTETFTSDEEDMQEESEEDIDPEEDPDENDDEDEAEDIGNRRQAWRPGKAYGHDLDEGKYYEDGKRTYRDKRYANRRRDRPMIPKIAY